MEQHLSKRNVEVVKPAPAAGVAGRTAIHSRPVSEGQEFLRLGRVLWGGRGRVLLAIVLGIASALLLGLSQTPIYQARAVLELQGVNENFLNAGDVNPTSSAGPWWSESNQQTLVEVMSSDSLLERVLKKLRPEERASIAARTDYLSRWQSALDVNPQKATGASIDALTSKARSDLQVETSRTSHIIQVKFDSPDPMVAATFANTLAHEFTEQSLEDRWKMAQRTGAWLSQHLEDLRIKLEKSEEALQEYARASGLLFTSQDQSLVEDMLRQLQQELSTAQAQRRERQSQYELVSSSPADSLPDVLDSAGVREQQVKLTDLRRELAEVRATFKPTYYRVKQLQAQIDELETALNRGRNDITRRIRNEFESAKRREELAAAAFESQSRLVSTQRTKAIQYSIVKREVDTNRHVYDGMLQKVQESGIAAATPVQNIRVVDPARPPARPYKPRMALNLLIGGLGGFVIGMSWVVLRAYGDRTLRGRTEAAHFLELSELGVIPAARIDPILSGRRRLLRGRTSAHGVDDDARGSQIELASWRRRYSLLAESFGSAAASLRFAAGTQPTVVIVTSPGPQDGKTTSVCNLGIGLARMDCRVLLIDADTRWPRLHSIFGLPNDKGLVSVLQTGMLSDPSLLETEVPKLFVMPSGPVDKDALDVLHSPALPTLLAQLRTQFDMILIDTPPMLQVADARVLSRLADGVVLVIRSGQTTRAIARAAVERLIEDGTPLLGSILNDWIPDGIDGYAEYYQQYRRYSRD